MKAARAVLFAFLAFWIVTGSFFAVPRVASRPPAVSMDDYPLEAGMLWIYTNSVGVTVQRQTVARDDGWIEMRYELPLLGAQTLLMRRTPEGVVAKRQGVEQTILHFPMVPGDAWTIDFPSWPEISHCRVAAIEEIECQGKKVRAAKLNVERARRRSGKKVLDHEWYVPGIGLARMQVSMGVTTTFDLTRFEKR